jgi:fumarate reductase subunit C
VAENVSRKPYIREVPKFRWFLEHPRYLRYMAREMSCVFIGAYTLLLVVGIMRVAEGPAAYAAFLQALQTPASIVFHILTLVFSAYHSITWFNLTPRALPIQVGEDFVPDAVIAGAHYAAWFVVTLAVVVLAGAFY